MFTTPAPVNTPVPTAPISPVSPSPRSTGLQRGISFLRNYTHGLHLHSADTPDGPRASPPRSRPRASTHTPPVSPFAATATATATAPATATATTPVQSAAAAARPP